MYKKTVGKGLVQAYEGHEVKYRVALVREPFYFINSWLTITDSLIVHFTTTLNGYYTLR